MVKMRKWKLQSNLSKSMKGTGNYGINWIYRVYNHVFEHRGAGPSYVWKNLVFKQIYEQAMDMTTRQCLVDRYLLI
jgi:hypothetical protein